MAKEIDDAGFALNKWYNANQKSLKLQSKHNVYVTRLGEDAQPMNHAQLAIEKEAMAAIKNVATKAETAIKAASNTQASPAPVAPADARFTQADSGTQASLAAFSVMRTHVTQVAGPDGVGREADEMVEEQSNLANEDKAYEKRLVNNHAA